MRYQPWFLRVECGTAKHIPDVIIFSCNKEIHPLPLQVADRLGNLFSMMQVTSFFVVA